jgi:predicted nucleic acid-binding protein
MSVDRYTLDANILVYAIDSDAGAKHVIARRLLEAATTRDCILSTQTLAETYNVVVRKQPKRGDDVYRLLSNLSILMQIVSANAEDFEVAMIAHRERPIHFWDAMLWATVRRHGCSIILTEDEQDRPVVAGIRYLNPFACSSGQLEPFT